MEHLQNPLPDGLKFWVFSLLPDNLKVNPLVLSGNTNAVHFREWGNNALENRLHDDIPSLLGHCVDEKKMAGAISPS